MIVLIDTSSLLSLVRYYLPFDKSGILYKFIKEKIENKEILVIDKVFEECRYTSKGLVLERLEYLRSKKNHEKTDLILPSKKFFNQLENNFINGSAKNKLTSVEFENRKGEFLESADAKLILYCLQNDNENITIVSEESESNNDNKAFKKLPSICKFLELEIITLPELIEKYEGINLTFG
ncbi:DUF4411 family protein [Maribacter sp. 2210JD10-5]|uniref:DUF4411 family protein n=1 Tax=Maribacter sp. 2210JD10-5 TaxID=3386272 RepID=UPI0039BC23AF